MLILLALGCAGRADKVKNETEIPKEKADVGDQYRLIYGDHPAADYYSIIEYNQPADTNLIMLYNGGELNEFYSILDTLYTSHIIKDSKLDTYTSPFLDRFDLEVREDSVLVTLMILDREKRLIDIVFNQILIKGKYAFFLKYDEMFDKYGSGIYHYLVRVGSEERLLKFTVLR
jgi:hypothetical protein